MSLLSRPARRALAAALALAAAPAFAGDHPYSQTVFFGDSLSDSGFFRPLLGPSGLLLGRFTTNPNLVWSELVAQYYGSSATPNGNGQNGSNYSAGGARVGVDVSSPLGTIPSLTTQMNNYLAAHGGRADPNALYAVWGGANDLFAVQADPGNALQIINGAVTAQIGIVSTLQSAGARYVLVPSLPDIGLTPRARSGGPALMAAGTALADFYNKSLYDGLASQGLRVIPVDTFHFLQEAVANPGLYGLRNVTTPGCGMQPPPANDSSQFCNPGSFVEPDVQTAYLFADGVHPTGGAHAMLSQLAISMLEAPRQIAVLPRSAAATGRARADIVATHLTERPEGDGMRWWTSLRGDSQRVNHGDAYDGTIPALSGGVDWMRGSWVYGAFAGFGSGNVDFGERRGSFDQKDATLGGFIGWYGENGLWVNGQLSYTQIKFDVDREVWIGPAMRHHHGRPDGENITAAVNAGWNLGSEGPVRHGPVLGLIAQRIDIDDFRESLPELSSSLAYPSQSYDSLIGSAGWQASYTAESGFTPYARLTYDHEFEKPDEEAFARSQSLAGTPNYAVPGLSSDRDYGTLTIGARVPLFGLDANFGGSATVERGSDHNASLFATLGKRF